MKRLRKWRLCNPSNLLDPISRMGFVGRGRRVSGSVTSRIFISAIFSMQSNFPIDFSFIVEDTSIFTLSLISTRRLVWCF